MCKFIRLITFLASIVNVTKEYTTGAYANNDTIFTSCV